MTRTKTGNSILVRNISDEVWALIEEEANQQGRSIEGQVRYAINASVMPRQIEKERRERTTGLARRLNKAYNMFLDANPEHSKSPSVVAEAIGLEVAGPIHKWLCGDEEPTFSQVKAMAKYFGCSYDWLQYEEGNPRKEQVLAL